MQAISKASTPYYKQIDGLRFFAVLGIMMFHWLHIAILNSYSLIVSNIAIDLFFVISGFLITGILLMLRRQVEEEHITTSQALKNFYVRRSLRIFPIYYLFIMICAVINLGNVRHIYPWLLTYTTNFLMLFQKDLGPYSHLWSLAIEEQFYLIFPLFLLWIPRQYIKPILLSCLILAPISRWFTLCYFSQPLSAYLIPFCCTDALCIGALLAHVIYHEKNSNSLLHKKYLLALGLFIFFICCYRFAFISKKDMAAMIFFRTSISICCAWIVAGAVQGNHHKLASKILENRAIVALGKLCYGLYLFHQIAPYITAFLFRLLPLNNTSLRIIEIEKITLNFLITVLLACLSWYLIEKPANNLKKYFTKSTNLSTN
jgi:peptidoglycan/LPS O-acetylase OafA/YrhL